MPGDPQLKSSLPRLDGVDTLRGIAILSVILLHIWLRLHFAGIDVTAGLPEPLADLLFRNGDNGVTIFFAISGFLITLTSLRRFGTLAAMRPRAFYRIRFARIAPLLLLELAVLSALHLLHAPAFRIRASMTTLPHALFAALTFHLNWLEGIHGYLPANWDVLWSLSVEEMFYLFFPLACLALLRRPRSSLSRLGQAAFIALLLAFVAMGPFARTLWSAGRPIWREKSYLGGMDAIALGCLTALLLHALLRRREHRAPDPSSTRPRLLIPALIALQLLGAAMMLLILYWPHWHVMRAIARTGTYGTILPLGTCLVILASVLRGASSTTSGASSTTSEASSATSTTGGPLTAPLRWFGRHSYELYMTHEFLVIGLTALYLKWPHGPLLLWVALLIALCAGLGAVTARCFSEPLNRRLRGARPALFT